MDPLLNAVFTVLLAALGFYKLIVIVMVIMSWLFAFNIINYNQQLVQMIWNVVDRLTEPVLRPIRNFMPNLGGVDLSPVILFLIILGLEVFLSSLHRDLVYGI